MSKKQELARFRNLSKGKLMNLERAITNTLHSLPEPSALTLSERENLLQARKLITKVLSAWSINSHRIINIQS